MTVSPFFVRTTDYAHPLNVVGEHITVLASGRETGNYEVFLQEGPEGSGPIPHTHPWDESFFVIRGEVDFSLGDDEAGTATVGTLVHAPPARSTGSGGDKAAGRCCRSPRAPARRRCSTTYTRKSHPTSPTWRDSWRSPRAMDSSPGLDSGCDGGGGRA
jgi:quercetin dioxygenase-like cupin family protein